MNPLDQLADISVPQSVSIWPLAWGYWAIIGIFILLVAFIIRNMVANYQHKALIRKTLRELRTISPTDANISFQLQVMLKKVCAHYYPQHRTHTLSEQQWVDFLMQNYTGNQAKRVQWAFEHINSNLYRASTGSSSTQIDASAQTLKVQVGEWLCHNHASRKAVNAAPTVFNEHDQVDSGGAHV